MSSCTGCEQNCLFPEHKALATCILASNARICSPRGSKSSPFCAGPSGLSAKSAIVLFNFPPNAGNTGTAAFLSVFESLHQVLGAMKGAGYTVEVPASVDDLRSAIITGTPPGTPRWPMSIPASRPRIMSAENVGFLRSKRNGDRRRDVSRATALHLCARGAVRQCLCRHPARVRIRRRSDATALRKRLFADARFSRLLPLLKEDFGAHAVLHSARMARWSSCQGSNRGFPGLAGRIV